MLQCLGFHLNMFGQGCPVRQSVYLSVRLSLYLYTVHTLTDFVALRLVILYLLSLCRNSYSFKFVQGFLILQNAKWILKTPSGMIGYMAFYTNAFLTSLSGI